MVDLDASRRWVTLSDVHPEFITACHAHEQRQAPAHLTSAAPVRHAGGVTRRLVLASASPVRARVLREAGFAPEVIVSGVRRGRRHRADRRGGPRARRAQGGRRRRRTSPDRPPSCSAATRCSTSTARPAASPRRSTRRGAWWASVAGPRRHPALGPLRDRHGQRPPGQRRGHDHRPLRPPHRARDGRLPRHGRAAGRRRRASPSTATRRPSSIGSTVTTARCSASRCPSCAGSSPPSTSRSRTSGHETDHRSLHIGPLARRPSGRPRADGRASPTRRSVASAPASAPGCTCRR